MHGKMLSLNFPLFLENAPDKLFHPIGAVPLHLAGHMAVNVGPYAIIYPAVIYRELGAWRSYTMQGSCVTAIRVNSAEMWFPNAKGRPGSRSAFGAWSLFVVLSKKLDAV